MSRLSRWIHIALALDALVCLWASPVDAWEFSISGKYTWEYQLYAQLGSKGFFGPYDQDNSTVSGFVNLAARNGWLGNEITGDRLSS
jgi:hypothetical protein